MQKFPFYLIKRPFSFNCKSPVTHSRKCTTLVIDEYDFEHFFFHHYNKKEATSSILVVFSWWKPAIVEAKASTFLQIPQGDSERFIGSTNPTNPAVLVQSNQCRERLKLDSTVSFQPWGRKGTDL